MLVMVSGIRRGRSWIPGTAGLLLTPCVLLLSLLLSPDPDKLIKGDPAIEEIFKWTDKMRIQWRGASGTGAAAGKLVGEFNNGGPQEAGLALGVWLAHRPCTGWQRHQVDCGCCVMLCCAVWLQAMVCTS